MNSPSHTFSAVREAGAAGPALVPVDPLPARVPQVNERVEDGDWRVESKLIGELTRLNTWISRYVLRHLDADAGRTPPIPAQEKLALGDQLVAVGLIMQSRARGEKS